MLIDNEIHDLYIRYRGIEKVKLKMVMFMSA